MASTGRDINEISDEESVTELEDTLPREIIGSVRKFV